MTTDDLESPVAASAWIAKPADPAVAKAPSSTSATQDAVAAILPVACSSGFTSAKSQVIEIACREKPAIVESRSRYQTVCVQLRVNTLLSANARYMPIASA